MPRGVKRSSLDTLKQQGVKIFASLQREIDAKEKDLAGLKAEAERWRSALGAAVAGRCAAVALHSGAGASDRLHAVCRGHVAAAF